MPAKTTPSKQPQITGEPKPPFPEQHLEATGEESKLRPRPRYLGERYRPASSKARSPS